jgi:hypothetical protein
MDNQREVELGRTVAGAVLVNDGTVAELADRLAVQAGLAVPA